MQSVFVRPKGNVVLVIVKKLTYINGRELKYYMVAFHCASLKRRVMPEKKLNVLYILVVKMEK